MLRLIPIAAFAALFAGCQTTPQQSRAPVALQSTPLQAGTGTITQIFPAPPNADAGGPAPSAARYQRFEIRMDSGRTQYVDVPATETIGEFKPGMRVRLTDDGHIRRS